MEDLTGKRIGKYQVNAHISSGGMGDVYRAIDTKLRRDVAIKFIKTEKFTQEEFSKFKKRFEQEAQTLANLDEHPNIVNVYDFGEYEENPYLVMKYLKGTTLSKYIGANMSCSQAASLLIPVADALGYIHKKGFLHRDVKPTNIIIRDDNTPVLIDFGIARPVKREPGDSTLSQGLNRIGTTDYMAPEQFYGEKDIDGQADQYALGMVFYELITGKKLSPSERFQGPIPSAKELKPELPDRVDAIFQKVLAFNPNDRYPSMEDFAAELRSLQKGSEKNNILPPVSGSDARVGSLPTDAAGNPTIVEPAINESEKGEPVSLSNDKISEKEMEKGAQLPPTIHVNEKAEPQAKLQDLQKESEMDNLLPPASGSDARSGSFPSNDAGDPTIHVRKKGIPAASAYDVVSGKGNEKGLQLPTTFHVNENAVLKRGNEEKKLSSPREEPSAKIGKEDEQTASSESFSAAQTGERQRTPKTRRILIAVATAILIAAGIIGAPHLNKFISKLPFTENTQTPVSQTEQFAQNKLSETESIISTEIAMDANANTSPEPTEALTNTPSNTPTNTAIPTAANTPTLKASDTPTPADGEYIGNCAMKSYLKPGDSAEVLISVGLRMRENPGGNEITIKRTYSDGVEKEVKIQAASGKNIRVLDGPVCMNGNVWFKVNYLGYEGWCMEGEDGVYYLGKQDESSSSTVISSESTPRNENDALIHSATDTPTAAPTDTNTPTSTATDTSTATFTSTPVTPTATLTATLTNTPSPLPTATNTPTSTATDTPTATFTSTPVTPTAVQISTDTPTAKAASTLVVAFIYNPYDIGTTLYSDVSRTTVKKTVNNYESVEIIDKSSDGVLTNIRLEDGTSGWVRTEHLDDAQKLYYIGRSEYRQQNYKGALETLIPAAEAGNSEAQYLLGHIYEDGEGVEQFYEKAAEWFQKAAAQGHTRAQYNLGVMYENGEGVEQSYEKAAEWYQKAAGNDNAQYNLGMMYENGEGVEQSYEKAAEWYQKAAENGNDNAQYNLGMMYENGLGVEQSYEKAAEWYQKAAENGNDNAQYNLGIMYENGLGVEQSYEKAAEWYQKAADQRITTAQNRLGYLYENGLGVKQSYNKALLYYRRSAMKGYDASQNRLGYLYFNGLGVVKSYEKAAEWYHRSAEQGNEDSQYSLGYLYENGLGVMQSYQKAFQWYQKSAEQGNASAQHNLGMMYENGLGVKQSYEKAAEWYQKAAENGNAYAQFNFGKLYEFGWGVEQSDVKAAEWYQKAADQGNEDAEIALSLLSAIEIEVITDVLMRNTPGDDAEVVRSIIKGDKVKLTGSTSGTWIRVLTKDKKIGWIPASVLEMEATPTAVNTPSSAESDGFNSSSSPQNEEERNQGDLLVISSDSAPMVSNLSGKGLQSDIQNNLVMNLPKGEILQYNGQELYPDEENKIPVYSVNTYEGKSGYVAAEKTEFLTHDLEECRQQNNIFSFADRPINTLKIIVGESFSGQAPQESFILVENDIEAFANPNNLFGNSSGTADALISNEDKITHTGKTYCISGALYYEIVFKEKTYWIKHPNNSGIFTYDANSPAAVSMTTATETTTPMPTDINEPTNIITKNPDNYQLTKNDLLRVKGNNVKIVEDQGSRTNFTYDELNSDKTVSNGDVLIYNGKTNYPEVGNKYISVYDVTVFISQKDYRGYVRAKNVEKIEHNLDSCPNTNKFSVNDKVTITSVNGIPAYTNPNNLLKKWEYDIIINYGKEVSVTLDPYCIDGNLYYQIQYNRKQYWINGSDGLSLR